MTELDRGSGTPEPGYVLALDNIALSLPLAGAPTRSLAALVDYILVWLALSLVLVVTIVPMTLLDAGTPWVIAVATVAFFLVHWGYFLGFELATGGRTPGKKLVQLRVVSESGGAASTRALVVRSLLRDLDLLVGPWLMVLDGRFRRLGDRLAGTVVVHDRELEPMPSVTRLPAGWGGDELRLAEALFARAEDLEPAWRDELARRLLARFELEEPALAAAAATLPAPLEVLRDRLGLVSSPA
jgi:uncharacterized RDD family membrane protein YckC